ncbi:MAG: hypothetical protein DMD91_11255 [Candidatus Rokuibacteriota bacterium]|nr:MAG: hypothetical protein DMD91_11255 [Candidatus Rokubacteria bacterium]
MKGGERRSRIPCYSTLSEAFAARRGYGTSSANVAGERIASKTVIWAAGVAPSPAGTWLKAKRDDARSSSSSEHQPIGTP